MGTVSHHKQREHGALKKFDSKYRNSLLGNVCVAQQNDMHRPVLGYLFPTLKVSRKITGYDKLMQAH